MELTADKEMEAREKLTRISDGLELLQDGRAGLVPRVKNFTCKLNFVDRPQARKPQKFVDHEMSHPTTCMVG